MFMTKRRRSTPEDHKRTITRIRLEIVTSELERMDRYLKVFEASLEDEKKQIGEAHDRVIKSFKSLSEDEQAMLGEPFLDDYWEASEKFPQLLLISFVIAWYAFVEQNLLNLCQRVGVLEPKERKNKYLDDARRLLETKKKGLFAKSWNKLKLIQQLRNYLVHEGREILWSFTKSQDYKILCRMSVTGLSEVYLRFDPNLFQYLKRNGLIDLSGPPFEIQPTFEYCSDLIDFGVELFTHLINELSAISSSPS